MENGNGIGIGRLSCKKLRAVKRYAYDLFLPFCAAKQKKANLSKEEATSLANLWLKTEMNSDIDNFNIEKLNYEETFKAIKILTYYTNKVKERNKNILKATY